MNSYPINKQTSKIKTSTDTSPSSRDLTIDIIKVCCTLWIVAFFHLLGYSNTAIKAEDIIPYSSEITAGIMGLFMFFSGFFLKKYSITTTQDILNFYKKRLNRFYFLYLFSIITLFIGGLFTIKPWFKSNIQLFTTILGINSFFKPTVGTLWFMSMLIFFYILTPFLLRLTSKITRSITITTILSILFVYNYFTNNLDLRMPYLFIAYFAGLFMPNKLYQSIRQKNQLILLGLVLFISTIFFKNPRQYIFITTIIKTFQTASVLLLLSPLAFNITKKIPRTLLKIIHIFSYLSLSIYLYHRQIYQFIKLILSKYNIETNLLTLYLIYLPTALICSYFIQCFYDYIFNLIASKNNKA